MQKQNATNHARYYPAHHFIFYPLLLIAISVSLYKYATHPEQKDVWLAFVAAFLFTGWLSFMMRQHYALGNQDRLVRLELRFRYFLITGKRMEPLELQLSFRQLAALRFASDEELPGLMERAIHENLSPRLIKNTIVHWLPDHMRI
jgi:Family of unknown function (DUF6526)